MTYKYTYLSNAAKGICGIYKITSPSGRVYIGQARNIRLRWVSHHYIKVETVLSRSFKKYGFDKHIFEIVHALPKDISNNILGNYEKLYVAAYFNCGISMLNANAGGYGGNKLLPGMVSKMIGRKLSDETRLKMSNSGKGKIFDDEHKQNISKALVGHVHSPETIEKLRKGSSGNNQWLGRKHTDETKKKISEHHKANPPWLGKKHTEETKEKIRLANANMIRKPASEETKKKMSEVHKARHEKIKQQKLLSQSKQ